MRFAHLRAAKPSRSRLSDARAGHRREHRDLQPDRRGHAPDVAGRRTRTTDDGARGAAGQAAGRRLHERALGVHPRPAGRVLRRLRVEHSEAIRLRTGPGCAAGARTDAQRRLLQHARHCARGRQIDLSCRRPAGLHANSGAELRILAGPLRGRTECFGGRRLAEPGDVPDRRRQRAGLLRPGGREAFRRGNPALRGRPFRQEESGQPLALVAEHHRAPRNPG